MNIIKPSINAVCSLCTMLLALCISSCSNDDVGNADNGVAQYITVRPSIGQMTRVTSGSPQEFEKDDAISVYAWTGTSTSVNTSALVVNDSRNVYDGNSAWTATPQMLWKDQETAHYFLSVYPARSITDFTADPYTFDVSDQETSDLLVATSLAGLKATNNPVGLTFNHAMAKLVVNLTFRTQWEGTPDVESVAVTVQTAATVDYVSADGTVVTATGPQSAVLLPVTKKDTCYTSIMVPQAGFRKIAITIDGKEYSYTHDSDIPLISGEYTTVNLIVGRDEITIGAVNIKGWEEGKTLNSGEAQEDNPIGDKTARSAEVGDYYMSDGSFVDKDATLSEEQMAACIGICFALTNASNTDLSDYSQTGIGGKQCNGYVVGLKNFGKSEYEGYEWSTVSIQTGARADEYEDADNNVSYDWSGYYNTQTVASLPSYSATTYPAFYHAINCGIVSPDNSSGWFLPTYGQLQTVLDTQIVHTNTAKARGDVFTKCFWTSSEASSESGTDVYFQSYVENGETISWTGRSWSSKTNPNMVRPVIAF